jgi:enoyl-CoA hydratase/3-hydroxyacyl-CoA dehydrogenase
MAFAFHGRAINKIGVIGSGQIGPDIALYFSKVFSRQGVKIVVVDISEEALAKGEAKLNKKIDRGNESGAFSDDWAAAMKKAVTFSSDYGLVNDADFIVEAATEDKGLKGRIFADLESRCRPDTIFASNSSHLEPERIFEGITKKDRCLVIHYFFPAERNPLVEIVPAKETSTEVSSWLMDLYESIGKVPIEVGSRYGYAIDPVFEGVFLAAALLAQNGVATPKEIDAVATKALGLTVGPFTAMNLTGGNPITNVGLDHYTNRINPWYHSPEILKKAVEEGSKWVVPGRGEQVEVDSAKTTQITEALQGAFFGICAEIVDSGISNVDDMNMAVELGLDMRAPFGFMNRLGTAEALRLVEAYHAQSPEFPVPQILKEKGASNEPFPIRAIQRKDKDGVAVLKIRRPKVLNALNQAVFDEIRETFDALNEDRSVEAVVLTGFGVKAFVSGADVKFLAKIETPEQAEATSLDSQDAINRVEACNKPVVCAYNGLAFGGGNELAMGCHYRIARADLKVLAAQPEPNLGIIPGAGGTQRLPRLIGINQAQELLRTGKPVSSTVALELGLVQELVDGDIVSLRERAIEIAKALAAGSLEPHKTPETPMDHVPTVFPELDLRHLSRAVDKILCDTILEGAKLTLKEGLKLEAKAFGEVCKLKDFRIGVDNFLTNGPRSKAPFVHG